MARHLGMPQNRISSVWRGHKNRLTPGNSPQFTIRGRTHFYPNTDNIIRLATEESIDRMAVPYLTMEAKIAAFLVVLCVKVGATFQVEPEIIGVVIDNPEELGVKGSNASGESEWSQVVNELAIALERVDKEKPLEDGLEEEEETSGKSRIMKRQIIKIPSSVTKVKVIAPNPMPQARPKRMPPMPRVPPYVHHHRKRPSRRPTHSRPAKDFEEDYEEPKYSRSRDSDGRRGKHSKKSKSVVKEVTPEEFYDDDDDHQYLSSSKVDSYQRQTKKSHARKPQRHVHYGSAEDPYEPQQRRARRPSSEDSGYDSPGRDRKPDSDYSRPARPFSEKRHVPSYSSSEYAHDREYEDYAASTIHTKQVPAPNLTGLNLIDPPDLMKEATSSTLRTAKESSVADYTAKSAPSSKDIASTFPQLYTSHNPQVMTNFGLDDGQTKARSFAVPKMEYSGFEDKSLRAFLGSSTRYNPLNAAASEHHVTTVPAGGSGLKVVQPPQLGIASVQGSGTEVGEKPRGNQRATIRDILQQDCPDYEMLGYCSSPPRYPTIQIADMANKCSDLQDVMASPVPAEPQDDLASFSGRSDDDLDIIFDGEVNDTTRPAFPESWPSWSRSGSESETACASEYTIIEPGYAREVTSGRWFVIVQNSDSSLQKVTTDTCLNPGKPCGGLAGMKCSRNRGFHNGIKSTRCIQRYTHQRLISWDPESPSKCPRIRVFRFPTACICHLRLM